MTIHLGDTAAQLVDMLVTDQQFDELYETKLRREIDEDLESVLGLGGLIRKRGADQFLIRCTTAVANNLVAFLRTQCRLFGGAWVAPSIQIY